jgi:adenylate cyclase
VLCVPWPSYYNCWVLETAGEGAWLVGSDGMRHTIHGSCSLGRADTNRIVIKSNKVSRRHALIHLQNVGEFWLIDFGSSNGTFLNKRRIQRPMRLTDGDHITVGDETFEFHQPHEETDEYKTLLTRRTLHQIESVSCWLLVADIHNFTPLSRSLESGGLEALLGAWIHACKEVIENHHGLINKYLGDGFLAYWRENDTTPEEVAAAFGALKELQDRGSPDFRIVLHLGPVSIGGMAAMGEESLVGKEVNLVFRLENLGRALGEPRGLSESAHARLRELIAARPCGTYELKGFEGLHPFFAA